MGCVHLNGAKRVADVIVDGSHAEAECYVNCQA